MELKKATFKASDKELFELAVHVRTRVFIEEQGVPAEWELDAIDERAVHVVILAPAGKLPGKKGAVSSISPLTDRSKLGNMVPIATARAFPYQDASEMVLPKGSEMKIGRVAVLKEMRGLGLGNHLMAAIEEAALASQPEALIKRFVLHSQSDKRVFYEKIGYEPIGCESGEYFEFIEDGMLHVGMFKRVKPY